MKKLIAFFILIGISQFTYSQSELDHFKKISQEKLMDSLQMSIDLVPKRNGTTEYRGEFFDIWKYSEKISDHLSNCVDDFLMLAMSFDLKDPSQKEIIALYDEFIKYILASKLNSDQIFKNSKAICDEGLTTFKGRDEMIIEEFEKLKSNMSNAEKFFEKIVKYKSNKSGK